MFLLDDLFVKPLFYIFKKIHETAQEEIDNEARNITTTLTDLYMRLEVGSISETEFDVEEKKLLDRLSELEEDNEDTSEDVLS